MGCFITTRGVALALSGVLLSLALVGCAMGRTDFALLNPDARYHSLNANAPVLLTTEGLTSSYVEIGVIHVSGTSRDGHESLNERLREEARRVGADAVLFVHYGTENAFSFGPFFLSFSYDVLTAEGVAVRKR